MFAARQFDYNRNVVGVTRIISSRRRAASPGRLVSSDCQSQGDYIVPVHVIGFASDEETKIAFEAYTAALGKVAYSWNFLLERLVRLFVVVSGMDRNIAHAIWYSSDSDRTQQLMLKAAIEASAENRWPRHPKAKDDLKYLITEAMNLGDSRNNAVHAPCILTTMETAGGQETDMVASIFSGHRRAKNLAGKQILVEFDWCERWAEELSHASEMMVRALTLDNYPWPGRPQKPARKNRKDLPDQKQRKSPPPPQLSPA